MSKIVGTNSVKLSAKKMYKKAPKDAIPNEKIKAFLAERYIPMTPAVA